MPTSTSRRPVAVDLFAGAGGFSLGIEQAGFDVLVAVEHDPIHAATYAFNFPLTEVLCEDASTLSGQEIKEVVSEVYCRLGGQKWNGQIDLVFGGPPCQGFSLMGKRLLNDDRNNLIFHFYRLVRELSPRYFVMENVPGMAVGKHNLWLDRLKTKFETAGYRVETQILNAADFGVPQNRRRLFVVGAANGFIPVSFPVTKLSTKVTVENALFDLPDLDQFSELKTTDEVLLSAAQLERDRQFLSPYTQMLRFGAIDKTNLSIPRLWNPQLLTSSMRTYHNQDCILRFEATLPNEREPISRLRRLDSKGLSHTLRAGTGHERGSYTSPRPIHPTLPRVISVREAARLHSFPDWFRFHQTKWHGFRQVGNAVPPLLARAIGQQIIAALCVTPSVQKEPIQLGDQTLLRFKPSAAANYWQER